MVAFENILMSASSDATLRVWDLQPTGSNDAPPELTRLSCDSDLYACTAAQQGAIITAGDASGRIHFLSLKR
jgi:hypothetical protein